MIFGSLRRGSEDIINCNLIKFITVAPRGKSQQTGFRFWWLLREFQPNILSRTSLLDRLLYKTDSRSVSKDGKVEAICSLPEQQESVLAVDDMLQGMVESLTSGINECWSSLTRLECVLQQNGGFTKHILKWENNACAVDFS